MFLAADSLFRIIGFDSQLIFDSIITGVNVFILFFALSYFLFNPAQKLLKNRSEKTRVEVEKILEDARKNAKKLSEEIISEAKTEAQNIVNRGNKEIELEKAKAVDDLKNQVVAISSLLASKIVKENVDAKLQDKLFKETLDEIGDTSWQD